MRTVVAVLGMMLVAWDASAEPLPSVLTRQLPRDHKVLANVPLAGGAIYSCQIGSRKASVVRANGKLVYTFGPPRRAEIRIVGDPAAGTISYLHSMYPHAVHQQLRFRNGAYSYVLYSRWAAPDYRGRGSEESAGLLIFKGARRVAKRECEDWAAWPDDSIFGGLPHDGEDITPDPSER